MTQSDSTEIEQPFVSINVQSIVCYTVDCFATQIQSCQIRQSNIRRTWYGGVIKRRCLVDCNQLTTYYAVYQLVILAHDIITAVSFNLFKLLFFKVKPTQDRNPGITLLLILSMVAFNQSNHRVNELVSSFCSEEIHCEGAHAGFDMPELRIRMCDVISLAWF